MVLNDMYSIVAYRIRDAKSLNQWLYENFPSTSHESRGVRQVGLAFRMHSDNSV